MNRLGIAEPADAATLVYGTAAASVLVRILLDHLGGTLAEGVLNSALAIAATCAAYGLSFVRLKGRAGSFHRAVPALLILRVSGVVLLAYLAVILFAGAKLPALTWALTVAALYLQCCEAPPPRRSTERLRQAFAWNRA